MACGHGGEYPARVGALRVRGLVAVAWAGSTSWDFILQRDQLSFDYWLSY